MNTLYSACSMQRGDWFVSVLAAGGGGEEGTLGKSKIAKRFASAVQRGEKQERKFEANFMTDE